MAHQIEWSDERPTAPGDYWLSVAPRHRLRSMGCVFPVVVHEDLDIDPYLALRSCDGGWIGRVDAAWLDGAQWSRRETPADPFEVTT